MDTERSNIEKLIAKYDTPIFHKEHLILSDLKTTLESDLSHLKSMSLGDSMITQSAISPVIYTPVMRAMNVADLISSQTPPVIETPLQEVKEISALLLHEPTVESETITTTDVVSKTTKTTTIEKEIHYQAITKQNSSMPILASESSMKDAPGKEKELPQLPSTSSDTLANTIFPTIFQPYKKVEFEEPPSRKRFLLQIQLI